MVTINGSSKYNSHIVFALQVTETSTNVASNTSTISWKLIGYMDDSGTSSHWYSYSENTGNVYINGNQRWSVTRGSSLSIGTNNRSSNPITIAGGSESIAHNADGSKSISVSFSFGPHYQSKITGSGTVTLTKIARASTFTFSPISLEFGGKFTGNISAASDSFRHILIANATGFGGFKEMKRDLPKGSFTLDIPTSWMTYIPNTTSMEIVPVLQTYPDSVLSSAQQIGENKAASNATKFTINVPSSVIPSCSVSVSDTTAYYNKYGAFVEGKSTASVIVSGSGVYGSSITASSAVINGVTYNGNNTATYFCSKSGTIRFSGKVTDSRGRTNSTGDKTFTVLPYNNPTGSLTVKRVTSTSDTTTNENGSAAVITYSYSISALNNKNSKKVIIYNGSTAIKTITDSYSGNGSITISAPNTSSLTIKMIVSDDFNSGITYQSSISSSYRLINFNDSGKGIGIGKFSEDNSLDVSMVTKFRKSTYINFGEESQFNLGSLRDSSMISVSNAKNGFTISTDYVWFGFIYVIVNGPGLSALYLLTNSYYGSKYEIIKEYTSAITSDIRNRKLIIKPKTSNVDFLIYSLPFSFSGNGSGKGITIDKN